MSLSPAREPPTLLGMAIKAVLVAILAYIGFFGPSFLEIVEVVSR
jgi:hypothetical protein